MRYPKPISYDLPSKHTSFRFRLTAQERKLLESTAKAQGVTMSDYIRQRCLMGTEAAESDESPLCD